MRQDKKKYFLRKGKGPSVQWAERTEKRGDQEDKIAPSTSTLSPGKAICRRDT